VVRRGGAGGVQCLDLQVAPSDQVVIADHDAGDGGQEDGVGAEIHGELVG
jgi:hypothetical protein